MEMESSLEGAKKSRSKQDIVYSLVANFAENKDGTRNKLVQPLRSASWHNMKVRDIADIEHLANGWLVYIIFMLVHRLLKDKGKIQSPTPAGFSAYLCYCISYINRIKESLTTPQQPPFN